MMQERIRSGIMVHTVVAGSYYMDRSALALKMRAQPRTANPGCDSKPCRLYCRLHTAVPPGPSSEQNFRSNPDRYKQALL